MALPSRKIISEVHLISNGDPTVEIKEPRVKPGPKPSPHTERLDTSVSPLVMSALKMLADLADTTPTDVARRVITDHMVCTGLLTEEEVQR